MYYLLGLIALTILIGTRVYFVKRDQKQLQAVWSRLDQEKGNE